MSKVYVMFVLGVWKREDTVWGEVVLDTMDQTNHLIRYVLENNESITNTTTYIPAITSRNEKGTWLFQGYNRRYQFYAQCIAEESQKYWVQRATNVLADEIIKATNSVALNPAYTAGAILHTVMSSFAERKLFGAKICGPHIVLTLESESDAQKLVQEIHQLVHLHSLTT